MKEIYQQTAEEVLERVESRESGLTDEQVRRSREKCGWNELAEGKKKSILQIFFEQYKDFLVLILIASAVISGMLGDVESAAVIVIVITINAILGTVQTVKAEQSLQSLKKLSGPRMLMNRNLLYTAVTRARKCVTVVGSETTFAEMIRNEKQQQRYSSLDRRIRELDESEQKESAIGEKGLS